MVALKGWLVTALIFEAYSKSSGNAETTYYNTRRRGSRLSGKCHTQGEASDATLGRAFLVPSLLQTPTRHCRESAKAV